MVHIEFKYLLKYEILHLLFYHQSNHLSQYFSFNLTLTTRNMDDAGIVFL